MAGHLLADRFARRIVAGPYLPDEDTKTPSKEPARGGGPFDPTSFSDDLAPPKPMPTKPHPQGTPPRPDVPMLMAPQSLQIRPQAPIPGLEVPGGAVPGENGKPSRMPSPFAPKMPGVPRAPSVGPQKSPVRGPLSGSGPSRGPGEPSTPARPSRPSVGPQKSPSRPSKPPSGSSAPKSPSSSSRLSNFDFPNTTSDENQPGPMPPSSPSMPPMGMPPSSAPIPPTPAPMQQQGLPSVGDLEPDWGTGSGSGNHVSDEGPDWAGHPYMDGADFNSHRADEGPDWAGHPYMDGADFNSARRKGFMFQRLSLRR